MWIGLFQFRTQTSIPSRDIFGAGLDCFNSKQIFWFEFWIAIQFPSRIVDWIAIQKYWIGHSTAGMCCGKKRQFQLVSNVSWKKSCKSTNSKLYGEELDQEEEEEKW
jgi:hypothetical protein